MQGPCIVRTTRLVDFLEMQGETKQHLCKQLCTNCGQQGFGNLDGEYWLGLEYLHLLTKQTHYKLRLSLEDWQGRQVSAEYDSFSVEAESDGYRLRLGEYQGTAGDSLSWHNNKAFTTLDRDGDAYSGAFLLFMCFTVRRKVGGRSRWTKALLFFLRR